MMNCKINPCKKVLFISNDAHHGGATIFLLNMIEWILANSNINASVLLRKDGEIRSKFERNCETFILKSNKNKWISINPINWLRHNKNKNRRPLQEILDVGNYDLIYINTIGSGDILKTANLRGIPVISHIHELETAIHHHGKGFEKFLTEISERIICVSNAVSNNLINQTGVDERKLQCIHGFIPVKIDSAELKTKKRPSSLEDLGIPEDAYIIGFCGLGILRKGIDLLIPLARLFPSSLNGKELHFIWIGQLHPEYPNDLAKYDIKLSGLSSRIHFMGRINNAAEWMSIFDLHVLLSREDSFPLVVLEAALQSLPTVCFEGAGGAPEFVRLDAGISVPYMDLQAMANAVTTLLMDENLRARMGKTAKSRLLQEHTAEATLPKVLKTIQEVIHGGKSSISWEAEEIAGA